MDDMSAVFWAMGCVVPFSLLAQITGETHVVATERWLVLAGRVGVSVLRNPDHERRDPMAVPGGNLTDPQ